MGERSDQIDYTPPEYSGGAGDDAGAEDTSEIRAGIEQTRGEMSETIDAIQERLSPENLKEQVKDQVREQFQEAKATVRDATIGKAEDMVRNAGDTLNEARYTLMDTIRQNPVPAAMVGLGLGWLFMNRRSSNQGRYARYDETRRYRGQPAYYGAGYAGDRYTYGTSQGDYDRGVVGRAQDTAGHAIHRAQDAVGGAVDQAQETIGSVVSQAQDTAGNVVSQAQETAGYLAEQAQFQAQRVEDRFQSTLYENPLAVGAAAIALGTAIGFALPHTERENQLLGEARDNLIDRAQSVAQDTMEKVQRVAGEVIDEAQTTAKESAQEQGLVGGQQRERGA